MQHLFWMPPPGEILLFPFYLIGLFGLGSLLLPRDGSLSKPQKLFLAGCLGIAATQSLLLTGLPLWVGVLAAFVGFGACAERWFRQPDAWLPHRRGAVLILLCAIPAFMTLGENLLGWDARAIWFYHGHLIYDAGGLFGVHWTDPYHAASHPDYPKLIAILSAQSSWVVGVWNERWPKLCLLVLLALSATGVAATSLGNRRAWLTTFFLFGGIGYLLWNGYADGYLAIFAFLAAFFLGEALETGDRGSLWCGLGSLSLLAQTKNEGLALGAVLVLLHAWGSRSNPDCRYWMRQPQTYLLALPILLWAGIRLALGIHNDLSAGFKIEIPLQRITDPGFWLTLASHWLNRGALMFVLLALIVAMARSKVAPRQRLRSPAFWLPMAAFVLYSGVVFVAYWATYWPLLDHLRSSFSRVAIPLYTLLLAAILGALPPGQNVVVQRD